MRKLKHNRNEKVRKERGVGGEEFLEGLKDHELVAQYVTCAVTQRCANSFIIANTTLNALELTMRLSITILKAALGTAV